MADIRYVSNPPLTNREMNDLFQVSWPDHRPRDFATVLQHSLTYICAFDERLVGFVNVAWDGGDHAFILDTTVHPDYRRKGMGLKLVRQAVVAAKERGVECVHVDFVPELREFYEKAGFSITSAGLLRVRG